MTVPRITARDCEEQRNTRERQDNCCGNKHGHREVEVNRTESHAGVRVKQARACLILQSAVVATWTGYHPIVFDDNFHDV